LYRTIRCSVRATLALAVSLGALGVAQAATPAEPGLLFHVSADHGFTADAAGGDPVPNFRSDVSIVPDGKVGDAIRWEDDGVVSWNAPGNIYARRGTLSFFWRARTPVGVAPFNIFRVGFADHTSWDMVFLRIDWNGHGFDAFVTDTNLARIRVSFAMPQVPTPDSWHHIAVAWDETVGIRLYVDGKEAARKDQKADLDSGLDQFGLAGRIIAPHQVQSRYSYMRGSDVDEIRVYDHMLDAADVAALAENRTPTSPSEPTHGAEWQAWLHRYGWDKGAPPALADPVTRIRKIEFADARDLKEQMWKGTDGIDETTWPGVYNRSRLPGRDDYFELPDWNVYVEGGKSYVLTVPPAEHFNRIEVRGAAYGTLSYAADGTTFRSIAGHRPIVDGHGGEGRRQAALHQRRAGNADTGNRRIRYRQGRRTGRQLQALLQGPRVRGADLRQSERPRALHRRALSARGAHHRGGAAGGGRPCPTRCHQRGLAGFRREGASGRSADRAHPHPLGLRSAGAGSAVGARLELRVGKCP
jgi:hypothetical protein